MQALVRLILWSGALTGALAGATRADTQALEDLLFQDIPMVISSTRTERSALDVPNAVAVLRSDEIRATGATSIEELLHWIPGLDVMRISRSDLTSSMRGLNVSQGNRLLVMIDGRSAYLDFLGGVNWESLNVTPQEIERIEFIRGPGSAMFGANALLGTINIITKSPGELPTAHIFAAVGPDSRHASATASARYGRLSLRSTLEYRSFDAFRNQRAALDPLVDRNRHHVASRDRLGNARLDYDFEDGAHLELALGQVDAGGDLLVANQVLRHRTDSPFLRTRYTRGPWQVQAFYQVDKSDIVQSVATGLFPPSVLPYGLFSSTADIEAQREFEWGDHQLLLGLNTRRLDADSAVLLGSRESEMRFGAFVQDEIALGDQLTSYLGVRVDRHPKAGTEYSPRLALVYAFSESGRVRASVSRSFRLPTMLSSYATFAVVPVLAGLVGNEDLNPESVTAWELGVRAKPHPRLQTGLDLFLQTFEDVHQVALAPAGPFVVNGTVVNGGRTTLWGGELVLDLQLRGKTRGFASYSFVEAGGEPAALTPRHKGSLGIRGPLTRRMSYALSASYFGHTEVEEQTSPLGGGLALLNPVRHPSDVRSRFTVDGYLSFQVDEHTELGLKARNLFHQVRRHYPIGDEIGSELLVTARYEF